MSINGIVSEIPSILFGLLIGYVVALIHRIAVALEKIAEPPKVTVAPMEFGKGEIPDHVLRHIREDAERHAARRRPL